MGITGLLKELRGGAHSNFQLKDLRGKTAAVDVSTWLYRAMRIGDPTIVILRKLLYLRDNGINAIVVFDGHPIDAKAEVMEDRKRKRDKEKSKMEKEAQRLQEAGNEEEAARLLDLVSQNRENFHKNLKQACKNHSFGYVQAPFEADSQIAFLIHNGNADFVITVDSDFITYGCKQILFNLKSNQDWLYNQNIIETQLGSPFNSETFRYISIAVGCDYLKSGIPGFGIKTAFKVYKDLYPGMTIHEILAVFTKEQVSNEAREKFMQADETFLHQLVYNPANEMIVPLIPYDIGKSSADYPFAGKHEDAHGEHWFPNETEVASSPPPSQTHSIPVLSQPYPCRKCPSRFGTIDELTAHRRTEHPVLCQLCEEKFEKPCELYDHMQVSHKPQQNLSCLFCFKVFSNQKNLRDHTTTHVKEGMYKCSECEEAFTNYRQLKEHVLQHYEQREFHCEYCNKGFRLKGCLTQHLRVHSGEKPFKCSECEESFISKSDRSSHMKYIHSDYRPFKCESCDKGFISKAKLNRHKTSHSDERLFQCEFCPKASKTRENLNVHIQNVHSNERPWKCTTCGQAFKRRPELTMHMRIHSGEKPHQCEVCQKRFMRQSYLDTHMTHDTFVCLLCEKGFKRNCHLLRHFRTKAHQTLAQSPN